MPKFDDQTIETLFGADDAEYERPERFKEYFFYNGAYSSVTSDLSIRILVGHKGVGKSALLKRAYLADTEVGKIAFWLQSGDIDSIKAKGPPAKSLVGRIEAWKQGIKQFANVEDYVLAVKDIATKGELIRYQRAIDDLVGDSAATNDFLSAQLLDPELAPELKLKVLSDYYRALDQASPVYRSLVLAAYLVGFALLAIPALTNFIEITRSFFGY